MYSFPISFVNSEASVDVGADLVGLYKNKKLLKGDTFLDNLLGDVIRLLLLT
jgi:hypothetical protein